MIQELIGKKLDKGIRRYLLKYYPNEADDIRKKAEEIFPSVAEKGPLIGGAKNGLYIDLDLFYAVISYYEASNHRIDGEAIDEIIEDIFSRMKITSFLLNINHKISHKILKHYVYRDYGKYIQKVKDKNKVSKWDSTWEMILGNRDQEGISFMLIGCPIAEYAKKYGYIHLMPHICGVDHAYAKLIHAKLVRTQTVAQGADYCNFWYIPDKSDTAKKHGNI